ncbi:putative spore protein YtfJ [compost metagenome]
MGATGVKVVPLDNQTHLMERVIDSAPQVFDKLQNMIKRNSNGDFVESTTATIVDGHM